MCPIDLKQIPVSCWAQFEFSLTQMLLSSAVSCRSAAPSRTFKRKRWKKWMVCFCSFPQHTSRGTQIKGRQWEGKGTNRGMESISRLAQLTSSSFVPLMFIFPLVSALMWRQPAVCLTACVCVVLRRGCFGTPRLVVEYGWVPCGSVWICQTSCQDRHFFFFKSNQIYCHPYTSIQNLCTSFPNSKNELWLNKKTSKKKQNKNQKTQTI